MDNESFQKLTLESLGRIDGKQSEFDEKLHSFDKGLSNLECDNKVLHKMMVKIGEQLDGLTQGQKRLERIILRMENDSNNKIRALFEKSGIHEDKLNDHDARLNILEEKQA